MINNKLLLGVLALRSKSLGVASGVQSCTATVGTSDLACKAAFLTLFDIHNRRSQHRSLLAHLTLARLLFDLFWHWQQKHVFYQPAYTVTLCSRHTIHHSHLVIKGIHCHFALKVYMITYSSRLRNLAYSVTLCSWLLLTLHTWWYCLHGIHGGTLLRVFKVVTTYFCYTPFIQGSIFTFSTQEAQWYIRPCIQGCLYITVTFCSRHTCSPCFQGTWSPIIQGFSNIAYWSPCVQG